MEDFASSHFIITSIQIQIDALKKRKKLSLVNIFMAMSCQIFTLEKENEIFAQK